MSSLPDLLLSAEKKDAVYADCARLVEDFLASRGGLKGFALKAALAAAKKARPDLMPRAARHLTPDFARALDPFFQSWRDHGDASFADHLLSHRDAAVSALLAAADERAAQADQGGIVSLYHGLRKGAEDDVARLLPGLGELIEKHAGTG